MPSNALKTTTAQADNKIKQSKLCLSMFCQIPHSSSAATCETSSVISTTNHTQLRIVYLDPHCLLYKGNFDQTTMANITKSVVNLSTFVLNDHHKFGENARKLNQYHLVY